MGKHLLDTKTESWGGLIKNSRVHKIPRYQRDYSWDEEHWEDLWNDLVNSEQEDSHYMGYLVLQNDPQKNDEYAVIDGQQRLTTLSIIALAVIKHIKDLADKNIDATENKEREELLMSSFIGYKDPSSLTYKPKLVLNRNNDDFYRSYLIRFRKPISKSKLKPSEKMLLEAFDYFYAKIGEKFAANMSGAAFSQFLNERVANYLIFTFITVDDELNAYKVFETLNSRGVRLSPTDLLKNYLFMVAAKNGESDIDQAETQWQSINNYLGTIDFPTYLRHFWNSRYNLVRKQNLFKSVRNTIRNTEEAFNLLDELEKNAQLYAAFSQPEDEIWQSEGQKSSIHQLKLFNVKQCFPLLLAAYTQFKQDEFERLLRCCVVISFRYNIIGGLNPNRLEEEYSAAAREISDKKLTTATTVFAKLKTVYVSDEEFASTFSAKTFTAKTRGDKLIRYILFAIENQISGKKYDSQDKRITVEHILPENPKQGWESFFTTEEQAQYVYRLGNLTLLEESKNSKECANKQYSEKLAIYKTSGYKLTNADSIYDEWTPTKVTERQRKLAKYATGIWRFE